MSLAAEGAAGLGFAGVGFVSVGLAVVTEGDMGIFLPLGCSVHLVVDKGPVAEEPLGIV